MSRPSLYARDLIDHLDFSLLTVTQLSQILMDNGSYRHEAAQCADALT